MRNRTLGISYN